MTTALLINRCILGIDTTVPVPAGPLPPNWTPFPEDAQPGLTGDLSTLAVNGQLISRSQRMSKSFAASLQVQGINLATGAGGVVTAKVQRTNSPESVSDLNALWEDMTTPAPYVVPAGNSIKSMDLASPVPAMSRLRFVATVTVGVMNAGSLLVVRFVAQPID